MQTADTNHEGFDQVVLPHLAAARRLARWLVRNSDDAEDLVQEASLRAFRYFGTFAGGNGRAWFLRIVRNTCWGWHRHAGQPPADTFDEECHSDVRTLSDPEARLLRIDEATLITRALDQLPIRARELLRLRELEGLSYRELAHVMDMPLGTVMSGLARARQAFRKALMREVSRVPSGRTFAAQ